jgi:hypothetical protein
MQSESFTLIIPNPLVLNANLVRQNAAPFLGCTQIRISKRLYPAGSVAAPRSGLFYPLGPGSGMIFSGSRIWHVF